LTPGRWNQTCKNTNPFPAFGLQKYIIPAALYRITMKTEICSYLIISGW